MLLLPQQSDTRWVCKHKAITVFKARFDCIGKVLSHFSDCSMKGNERVEVTGLLKQLHDFQFVFTLHLLDIVLPLLSCATTSMQRKSTDICNTLTVIQSTVECRCSKNAVRNDQSFEKLYAEVLKFCQLRHITIPADKSVAKADMRTPRVRNLPKAMDDFHCVSVGFGSAADADSTVSNTVAFRRQMFAIVDRLNAELDRRFTVNAAELSAAKERW